ncbi:MAG: GGDEF domain-containing protein [Acidobacteriaceae bacterium]
METRVILIISMIIFSCGCIGLVTVRLTNPFFKGLGWVGAAFAAGALGAIFFAARVPVSPGVGVIVPDTFILLAYVFLQVCILELTESRSLIPRLGIFLLVAQGTVYGFVRHSPNVEQFCIITLGLFLAIQALQTAALLKRSAMIGMAAPVWFSVALLGGFAAYNIFRSILVFLLRTPQDPQIPNPLEVTTALVFLGTGLGLGFGVFWMASTHIRVALEGLANTDPLTGIFNRRIFTSLCEKELLRSTRTGEPFSLILFDLDHFKQINDRYGHAAGDAVLCAVVEKLRNSVRNIDIVSRWGGEEFIALLPNADSDAALLVAQRLRRSVESLSIEAVRSSRRLSALRFATAVATEKEPLHVTISIGVATCMGQVTSIGDLLHECDAAMYQAKAEGRNRIVRIGIPQYALFQ